MAAGCTCSQHAVPVDLGDNMEYEMGPMGFLLFYLACGLAAAGLQVLGRPLFADPDGGASRAIAGVMGGYLLLFPKARVDIFVFFIIFIRIFPVARMADAGGCGSGCRSSAVFRPRRTRAGSPFWAHAGGFIAGLLLALPLWLRLGGPAFWERTHGLPPAPGRELSACADPHPARAPQVEAPSAPDDVAEAPRTARHSRQ